MCILTEPVKNITVVTKHNSLQKDILIFSFIQIAINPTIESVLDSAYILLFHYLLLTQTKECSAWVLC